MEKYEKYMYFDQNCIFTGCSYPKEQFLKLIIIMIGKVYKSDIKPATQMACFFVM